MAPFEIKCTALKSFSFINSLNALFLWWSSDKINPPFFIYFPAALNSNFMFSYEWSLSGKKHLFFLDPLKALEVFFSHYPIVSPNNFSRSQE